MKLVDGGDLTQRLPQLVGDSRAVAELIATLAEAIHHAHQRGILHRDLKPRNILLDAAGVPQITDFGLAKQVDASGELTQSGAIVGTAGYMAPEQARGERTITTAVDVYSLGAILYELLTGRPPFRGATPAETILRVRADEPVRPTAIRPDVDRDLETVCLKCLEKDPLRRYPSAAALAEDVRRWLAGLPITARPVGPAERLWRWCRRNPVLAVGGVLVLALSGVFSWSLWDENCETRAALAREGQALAQAQLARDEAQDHLARSLYEQARGLALSAPAESRWRILGLLEQSRVLQRRPRAGGGATAEQRQRLPNASELRSEAVGALLRHDLRLAWQRNMQGAQPALVGDGRRVIFREGTSLVFLDWARSQELSRWSATEISGTALAVDASGRWLAAWSPQGGQVNVWDLTSGTRTQTLPWPPRADSAAPEPEGRFPLVSSDLSWSPDAQHLAAVDRRAGPAGRQALTLWNLSGNGRPRSLTDVSQDTDRGGAQFTADGSRIAYPTGAETLTFWQTATSDPSRAVRLPLPIVGGWELDASGRRLVGLCAGAGEHAGTLVVWDLADDREAARVPTEFSLKGAVVALDPAGRRAALGTRDGRLCVVALATGQKLINRPAAHPFAIGRLGWNRDGGQLASWGVVDGGFRCWEVADPPAIDVRTSPKLRHFTFSPDGRRLAAADAQEPRIRVFDRAAGAADHDLWGSDPARPGLLVFSPDGRQLAEINAYCVVVWDLAARQLLARLEQASGLEGLITSVAFSPEGRLLAAVASAGEPRVAVWDVLGCRQVWRAPADSALTLGYLVPGGRLLAGIGQPSLASPAQMSVIEFSTGRLAAQVAAPPRSRRLEFVQSGWPVVGDAASHPRRRRPGLVRLGWNGD